MPPLKPNSDATAKTPDLDGANVNLPAAAKGQPIKGFAELIPKWWKVQNGLDPNDPNVEQEDPDGDGTNNLNEFLNGTNPQVADLAAQELVQLHSPKGKTSGKKSDADPEVERPDDKHLLHHEKTDLEPQE